MCVDSRRKVSDLCAAALRFAIERRLMFWVGARTHSMSSGDVGVWCLYVSLPATMCVLRQLRSRSPARFSELYSNMVLLGSAVYLRLSLAFARV